MIVERSLLHDVSRAIKAHREALEAKKRADEAAVRTLYELEFQLDCVRSIERENERALAAKVEARKKLKLEKPK